MKLKALLIALLAMTMAACDSTNTKENNGASQPNEQTADALGTLITADGVGSLTIESEIPDTIPGYDIVPINVVYEEDIEDIEYHVIKGEQVVLMIHPAYVDETDEPSNFIGGLTILSDQFATADGIRVGSSIQDVLKKEGVKVLFDEQVFHVIDKGMDYIVFAENYEGELPAVPFDIMAEVEHPSFKPDAKVNEIVVGY